MNKQESQNQVSIIINGVRYEAVSVEDTSCDNCDLSGICEAPIGSVFCVACDVADRVFKKSDGKNELRFTRSHDARRD